MIAPLDPVAMRFNVLNEHGTVDGRVAEHCSDRTLSERLGPADVDRSITLCRTCLSDMTVFSNVRVKLSSDTA